MSWLVHPWLPHLNRLKKYDKIHIIHNQTKTKLGNFVLSFGYESWIDICENKLSKPFSAWYVTYVPKTKLLYLMGISNDK